MHVSHRLHTTSGGQIIIRIRMKPHPSSFWVDYSDRPSPFINGRIKLKILSPTAHKVNISSVPVAAATIFRKRFIFVPKSSQLLVHIWLTMLFRSQRSVSNSKVINIELLIGITMIWWMHNASTLNTYYSPTYTATGWNDRKIVQNGFIVCIRVFVCLECHIACAITQPPCTPKITPIYREYLYICTVSPGHSFFLQENHIGRVAHLWKVLYCCANWRISTWWGVCTPPMPPICSWIDAKPTLLDRVWLQNGATLMRKKKNIVRIIGFAINTAFKWESHLFVRHVRRPSRFLKKSKF